MARVQSNEDGTFEFAAVPSGDWRVTADVDPENARPKSGVVPALIADKDIANLQIRLSTSFSVEVTADWGNLTPPQRREGGPVPTAYLVHLLPLEGQPQVDFNGDGPVTSVNGAFPGRYLVTEFHAGDAIYASQVTFAGRDVLGQVIDLYPGIGPLQIAVKGGAGAIRGTAENGEGATAFLISKGPGELIDYQTTACLKGGVFEFRGVIPGDYSLVVLDQGGALPPAQLPDGIVPLATTIRVEAGSSVVPVNVRVNHGPW
jgi:hypothetical protein